MEDLGEGKTMWPGRESSDFSVPGRAAHKLLISGHSYALSLAFPKAPNVPFFVVFFFFFLYSFFSLPRASNLGLSQQPL